MLRDLHSQRLHPQQSVEIVTDKRQPLGSFERSSSEDSADVELPLAFECATQETVVSCHNFWTGVRNQDLMDDVMKEIIGRIQNTFQRCQHNVRPEGRLDQTK